MKNVKVISQGTSHIKYEDGTEYQGFFAFGKFNRRI